VSRAIAGRAPTHQSFALTFKEPRNWFQGINSASLCNLVHGGSVRLPYSFSFHSPIDCLKTPAQVSESISLARFCTLYQVAPLSGKSREEIWSNRPYVALALSSLLSTCVVFWSHRRRDIGYTAVIFLPERMYIILDSSACTSYPSLKRHKCLWRFGKATGLRWLSSFLLSQ
jgi:hypothetical protein